MSNNAVEPLRLLAASAPVLLIAVLVVFFNMSALGLSLWGFVFTAILAGTVFHTPFTIILLAALDGIITTVPLLLIVFFGIILSTVLIRTGVLSRIVNALSRGFRHPIHQVSAICFGIENFVAGAGVITEPIIAPTLKAVGVPDKNAAVLASWGYAGMMSFSLAGVFVLILSLVTGLDLHRLAVMSAIISLAPTLVFGILLPFVGGTPGFSWRQVIFSGSVAFVCGILILFFAVYVSSTVAAMLTGLAVLGTILLVSRGRLGLSAFRLADMTPFLILIASLTLVNMYPPLHRLAGEKLSFSVSVIPVHVVMIRPLLDAYTYLAVAIAVSVWVFRIRPGEFRDIVKSSMRSTLKAVTAMAVFGAMGQVIAFTGYASVISSFSLADNIPYVLAHGLSSLSGTLYPVFAPVLGWAGTFLTGYGSLSIMIFGKLQLEIAQFLHVSPETLSSAMMVGSGIGSVSSPFKIAMASSLVDAVGREGEILRKTIPLGIAISLVTGIWTYVIVRLQ